MMLAFRLQIIAAAKKSIYIREAKNLNSIKVSDTRFPSAF